MFAEVLAIGDELTSGQRLDTNSQWLSQQLEQLGIEVRFHTTVGDELEANIQAFQVALERVDLVVSTGGLGPTDDDLTRQALAATTGRELALDPVSLEHIRRRFALRGLQIPAKNEVQAMFPHGSRVISNPNGTAPGIDLDYRTSSGHLSRIIALPGVPAEMKEMWQSLVAPTLVTHGAGRQVIRHHVVKCFGVGESQIEAMLPDLIRRGRDPRVGITVHQATISLRIAASGSDETVCQEKISQTVSQIRSAVGDLVFGEGDEELQDAVVRQLRERGETLTTVEGSTSGMLAWWLGTADPARQIFIGGTVLPPEALSTVQQIEDVARQNLASSGATYAIALGRIPESQEVDEYHIVLATADTSEQYSSRRIGHPEIWGPRMAKQGLDLLRRRLLAQYSTEES